VRDEAAAPLARQHQIRASCRQPKPALDGVAMKTWMHFMSPPFPRQTGFSG